MFNQFYWKGEPITEKEFADNLRKFCNGICPTQPQLVKSGIYVSKWLKADGDKIIEVEDERKV